jgi:hypothetical protein
LPHRREEFRKYGHRPGRHEAFTKLLKARAELVAAKLLGAGVQLEIRKDTPDFEARNLALTLGQRFDSIRFLIRDRGSNFTPSFDAVFQATGTRILRTAVQVPRMNAICERLAGTLRRELLDRVLILGEAHLRAVLAEYQVHYNTARPHQGIAQRVPDGSRLTVTDLDRDRIHRKPRPGRPDQRICARRLMPRRPAGHQADPIFERDRCRPSSVKADRVSRTVASVR